MLSAKETSNYRYVLQKLAYAREGRPYLDFLVSYLQGKQSAPTQQNWRDLMHLLGYIKRVPEREVVFRTTDLELRAYANAAFNITADGHLRKQRSPQSMWLYLTYCGAVMTWRSLGTHKRQCPSGRTPNPASRCYNSSPETSSRSPSMFE